MAASGGGIDDGDCGGNTSGQQRRPRCTQLTQGIVPVV